jgi:hypothetical protein
MPPRHKIAWLIALGSVLAAWLFLMYRVMDAEQALYDRQLLQVEGVALTPALEGDAGDGLKGGLRSALEPLLQALSGCLATPTGTLAPATLTLTLDAASAGVGARWGAASPLTAQTERCLASALSPAPAWPATTQRVEATITLTSSLKP